MINRHASLLLVLTGVLLGPCLAWAGDVSVRLQGAPEHGELVFQVYDSPNAFGDFRDPLTEVRTPVRASGDYKLADLPSGRLAVLVYLDENGNGLLDENFIGIPKEPLAISNDYRPKGAPAFDRAAVAVLENQVTELDLTLYRVLGERGRFGLGLGVIGRGSPYRNSSETVLQPIPVITYNGERLQWLGPNLRYTLAGSGRWQLAATASYRIGAYEEDDSPVLVGLGDREGTLMAGLGLRVELPAGVGLQASYEHDVLDRIGGGSAALSLSRGYQFGAIRITPRLGLSWLSASLSDYDFGVPMAAATAQRPAYAPGSALSGELGFNLAVELTENWRLDMRLTNEFLPDEVTDSPIVSENTVLSGFGAITYVF